MELTNAGRRPNWLAQKGKLWIGLLPLLLLALLTSGCHPPGPDAEVILYAAQDQVYAEPILAQFTEATGIRVRTVFDNEAVKTVGLANRLLAERRRPRCDVFWGNEELRTRQLAEAGVFRETNGWSAFGFRSRRLVINTNLVSVQAAPRSLVELTNAHWHGHVALAYPLFGTTSTHFLTLRQLWGEENWLRWCRALQANKPFVVDGNSVVVDFVGRGDAWIGLTDSDDVRAGQRKGLPVAWLPLTREMLLIPNTVGLVREGPNPTAAAQLYRHLLSRDVSRRLVEAGALEGDEPGQITAMTGVDWAGLIRELGAATEQLKAIFLR